jgi:hypothetical protein
MSITRTTDDQDNYYRIKSYYNDYAKEKWFEFEYYEPVPYGYFSIFFGKSQDKVNIFIAEFGGADCEITMDYDNIERLSKYLIKMAQKSKENNLHEDNLRTVRFESSDQETDYCPEGMAGNIIIIACLDMVQIIIHFDDPREEWTYSLVMRPNAIIELANQLQDIINEDK